ncbi:hypothetical protein RD110_19850 [Rhodoferax koreense]|uniref:HTH gntR-type domain-containing protein n=1 Tax=Rhodoferax koreensis TaxID=1842727 RepID=A0A1P8JZT0_9BURK|nr:GntR family transcriptional regulator [Rhodoferax koreense]APW39191.1 hypothetical protein RD110_19850 [Rhodoferax koreense]
MANLSIGADPSEGNKTEAAYRRLRQAILGAQLPPGAALRPAALQAAYGMGWTPLREALSRLEAERLVTTEYNRGFAVAPVSLAELEDLTRARRALEAPLLAESITHGDKAWEDGLILAHYRLHSGTLPATGWSDEAINQWLDLHQAFHMALLGGGRSIWLMHFYRQTMEQERRHHRVLMIVPLLREEASAPGETSPAMAALRDAITTDHHTALMQAALARDLPRASALMAEHVNYKSQVFASSQPAETVSKPASAPPRRRGRPSKPVAS